jgi:Uma2 family endonuclease
MPLPVFVDKNHRAAAKIYPESDGKPMSDNTLQAEWIFRIFGNLMNLYRDQPDVFVAANHLIYPVEGKPKIRVAPDVYVAFGRPKGHRGSYRVFDEEGIFPQVIFEVLSPKNTKREMEAKRRACFKYGAEEFYIYHPKKEELQIWVRGETEFVLAVWEGSYLSPRLGITFENTDEGLIIRYPNGRVFDDLTDFSRREEENEERLRLAEQRLVAEKAIAEAERQRHERDLEALRAKLRAAGIDPEVGG